MQEGESRLHAGADLSERFSEPFSVLDVCKISDLSGTRIRGTSRKSVPLTVPVIGLFPLTDHQSRSLPARIPRRACCSSDITLMVFVVLCDG